MYEKIIAVTNRHLSQRPYFEQIERICRKHPQAILLRERDLPEKEYVCLLNQVQQVCSRYHVTCIAHTYIQTGLCQNIPRIHLPLPALQSQPELRELFLQIGVSVHSIGEAELAWKLGADYLTAGHIFSTDCKPGLPPRGTEFLKSVCQAVDIPVYSIGGMQGTEECISEMISCGAAGICVMSECMSW